MKRAFQSSAFALLFSLAGFGCALTAGTGTRTGVQAPIEDGDKPGGARKVVDRATAEAEFKGALAEMARLDREGGWTEKDCGEVAERFLDVAVVEGDALAVRAVFNAGIAHERCGQDEEAKRLFDRALALSPGFHPATVHLVLMRHRESGGKDLDRAIADMRQAAIVEAKYTNVEALVALAMLSLERDGDGADADGPNDRARAVRYLQSALSVDDGHSPAMNGLALYYLGEARSAAGRRAARARMSSGQARAQSTQAMELAALVCLQALRRNPNDAVVHNTYGIIQVELGNLGKAAESFGKARQVRPGFYEAEMNFAAINLRFRGFAQAEEAYRRVLKARPKDYDARVGLALAIRGQIRDGDEEKTLAAAKELEAAKEIAPDRPEAYFNEGILVMEHGVRASGTQGIHKIGLARGLFQQFLRKAGSVSEYTQEVKAARERLVELDQIEQFLEESAKAGS